MRVKEPDKAVAQKYVVLTCVNKLANIGYTMPTYSSVSIQAMDASSYHDVAGFCARVAQNNRNDVVSRSQTYSLYPDLLLLESLVLISIFLPTLNYRLRTMT